MKSVRVAALQFAAGVDVRLNQQKVLQMIDRAAAHKPDLMVLPEFANHASWYDDAQHCYRVSLALDGDFVARVAAKANTYQCYIVLNATLQRPNHACTGSSILIDRRGAVLAVSDKQVLMGHENDYLTRATQVTPVVETDIGRLGLYACMDGVIPETPRSLAVRGAQILCNSLNSFAVDEASLHVPVRAAENKVFVVAANKVGPLIPVEQLPSVSQFSHIPEHFLHGAGESQIVAPDGTVLVRASLAGEEVIFADIDPALADAKTRPDGNTIFAHRRRAFYRDLALQPEPIDHMASDKRLAASVRVGCWQGRHDKRGAVQEFVDALPQLATDHDLIVLPELFFMPRLNDLPLSEALERSQLALQALQPALAALPRSDFYLAGSFLTETGGQLQHTGIVLSSQGALLRQLQIHQSVRYQERLQLATGLEVLDTPYGRLALVVGEDAIYPEVFRLLALRGVDLVAISGHVQERWEIDTGLVERAAENRLCLAFATRPQAVGASLLADLEAEFTLLTEWRERRFDGNINKPRVRLAPRGPGVTGFVLHPERATNKVISSRTHLLHDRPWQLLAE